MYLIYMKFKATYDGNHDTFRVEFLVVPVGGLAFLVNHDFSPLEVRNIVQTHYETFLNSHLASAVRKSLPCSTLSVANKLLDIQLKKITSLETESVRFPCRK